MTNQKTYELYGFQKQAVNELLHGRKICVLMTGAGKTAVMFNWLKATGKKRIVIATTATKAKSGDMEKEAVTWCGQEWLDGLELFTVVSWHKLYDLSLDIRLGEMNEYAFAFDEVQKSKGYSSKMGKAFIRICTHTNTWTGYTATPGDQWKDFIAYFVAAGLMRNKTEFMRNFAIVQTFRGFPEISHYIRVDDLKVMWNGIMSAPDTRQLIAELPHENHSVVEFPVTKQYHQCKKERKTIEGEFIDSTMGLCHYLRQLCFTPEKQAWLADFIENLGTNCVFFCNYIEEEDVVCEIASKVLPKGAKIWRIDGKHHDIPTAETIGRYDIVVAHYLSGGEALNLQFMHYWCSVSPNYSYSTSVQARGRIKRIGQKHPMFYYYLKTVGSIEDEIYNCLRNKSDFSEKVWAKSLDEEFG